ncbi:hypothetical protein P7C71_g4311, partial [Lecanoromycetidae sp. Uapishka_2]
MDPVFRFPASPGTPLFPVSPERANRQQLPQSPSLPSLQNNPFLTHSRGNSDVQGKVAQFNNLSREAAQRRKDSEAALKRAVLGREEAESETRRVREDNTILRRDVEEGRARERKMGERLEDMMEELSKVNETQAHEKAVYEKEIRRARKEAFKSSSALVNLQEELKSARNRYTLMREEVDVQRRKVGYEEQKAAAATGQLVELQEQLEKLMQQIKVVEHERDALKVNLQEEEVARIAAEGAVALPLSPEADELAPPRKRRHRESLKENLDPRAPEIEDQLLMLKEELRTEKRMRLRADDQVQFMKMECQFQCCSCRVAERQGVRYIHDSTMEQQMSSMAVPVIDNYEAPTMDIDPESTDRQHEGPTTPPTRPSPSRQNTEQLLTFSPTTGTFYKAPSPIRPNFSEQPSEPLNQISPVPEQTPVFEQAPESLQETPPTPKIPQVINEEVPTSPMQATPSFTFPLTPRPLPIPPTLPRTISHTTTIPLRSDEFFSPAPATPGGISREEALEQIRQRRGRARSIAAGNGTPRKRLVEVGELRRDISAPGKY